MKKRNATFTFNFLALLFTATATVFFYAALTAQPDSAEVMEIVKTGDQIGQQFLPPAVKPFGYFITVLVTTIAAAIIRAVEKAKLKKQHKAELEAAKNQK